MTNILRGHHMVQTKDPDTDVIYFYVLNPEGGWDNPSPLLTDVTLYYPNGDVTSISRNVIKREQDIISHISKTKK